jgi:hypothetical protein
MLKMQYYLINISVILQARYKQLQTFLRRSHTGQNVLITAYLWLFNEALFRLSRQFVIREAGADKRVFAKLQPNDWLVIGCCSFSQSLSLWLQ